MSHATGASDPVARVSVRDRVVAAAGDAEIVFRAPGRANLIGEHTDHNDGFVLPVALELETVLAGRRRDGRVVLTSLDAPGRVEVDVRDPQPVAEGWGTYVAAVVRALADAGVEMHGVDGVIGSSVPLGSGLSSSAALEIVVATALAPGLPALEKARLCREAERVHVGVQVGIMDQLASAAARAGHALLVDCRTLHVEHVPFPPDLAIVVIDSGVSRDLQTSAYNDRKRECEHAAASMGLDSLRDATRSDLEAHRDAMGADAYKRARHVVTENARVLQAVDALRRRDHGALGDLFAESHRSLADDFEASLPEIDALVAIANATPGVVGARLTGAGWGGCTVNLVSEDEAESAEAAITSRYAQETGRAARHWRSRPAPGADRLE